VEAFKAYKSFRKLSRHIVACGSLQCLSKLLEGSEAFSMLSLKRLAKAPNESFPKKTKSFLNSPQFTPKLNFSMKIVQIPFKLEIPFNWLTLSLTTYRLSPPHVHVHAKLPTKHQSPCT
jgi:hypothetical protein